MAEIAWNIRETRTSKGLDLTKDELINGLNETRKYTIDVLKHFPCAISEWDNEISDEYIPRLYDSIEENDYDTFFGTRNHKYKTEDIDGIQTFDEYSLSNILSLGGDDTYDFDVPNFANIMPKHVVDFLKQYINAPLYIKTFVFAWCYVTPHEVFKIKNGKYHMFDEEITVDNIFELNSELDYTFDNIRSKVEEGAIVDEYYGIKSDVGKLEY